MSFWILSGSLLAFLTYFPLWKQIRSGKVEQNFLTWVLWGTLDFVVAATILSQGGSFLLPIVYGVGSFVTAIFIAKAKGVASWTWFESLVSSLVLVGPFSNLVRFLFALITGAGV